MRDKTDSRLQPSTCVHCASPLVQPTEWARVDDSHWRVSVRCPECYRGHEFSLTKEQVTELSYFVEEGFRCLLEVMDQLDHEAFEGECETIIKALRSDNLYPMDF